MSHVLASLADWLCQSFDNSIHSLASMLKLVVNRSVLLVQEGVSTICVVDRRVGCSSSRLGRNEKTP